MARMEIDIENLLQWAYRDELSKRQLSSAEGIWDRIEENQHHGGIDRGHGAAQRYCHFGLPDADAELIEKAVAGLADMVIDWAKNFDPIAAELRGLIAINEVSKPESRLRAPTAGWGDAGTKALKAWYGAKGALPHQDRPRDVLMVGGLQTAALVTMHAIKGTRPDWQEEPPTPSMIPATKGPHAMVYGECKGRNLYTAGSHCPLKWEPSPLSIVTSRAEYVAWHHGITRIAETIELRKFIALPPKALQMPWLNAPETMAGVIPVMPTGHNSVGAWGTLPLSPARGRKGPPLRTIKAGPVRYPLEGEVA